MTKAEILRVQSYLRRKFEMDSITLHQRSNKDDSVEVTIGDEFIGVVFRDEEDGEVSYDFHMAIIEADLPNA